MACVIAIFIKDLIHVSLKFFVFFVPSTLGMAVLEGESYSLSDYRGSILLFPESRLVYPLAFSYSLFIFSPISLLLSASVLVIYSFPDCEVSDDFDPLCYSAPRQRWVDH